MISRRSAVMAVLGIAALRTGVAFTQGMKPAAETPLINPPPTAKDWADLAKLPDWSGVWTHIRSDQNLQMKTNPPPWNEKAAKIIEWQYAEEKAGRPPPLFQNCLPEAMPAWMLVTHNAMEIFFSPGRVIFLGESDSQRLRRIYTDGRGHPPDPDPTFHGHSIGKWDGENLLVDTIAMHPQNYIAISEAQGIPNGGDMHIKERMYLQKPDIWADELTITAPKVLTKPWVTTRIYTRQRLRRLDIVEGTCLEGWFKEAKDKDGYPTWERIEHDVYGNRMPPK
jgi:hypothetical protein